MEPLTPQGLCFGMSSVYVINLVLKVLVSMKLNEVFGHRLDLIEIDGI